MAPRRRETELLRRAFKIASESGLIAWAPKVPRLVRGQENAKEASSSARSTSG